MTDRWHESDVPRGEHYDRRFDNLAAAGVDVHGEAALVDSYRPATVLDAGCGTGRLAIELGRRGRDVVGVDVDAAMLDTARAKAPAVAWLEADLTDPALDFGRTFDVVVMAGNVLIFVPSGTEAQVIANAGSVVGSGWPPRRRLLHPSRRPPPRPARFLRRRRRPRARGPLVHLGPPALGAGGRLRRLGAPTCELTR